MNVEPFGEGLTRRSHWSSLAVPEVDHDERLQTRVTEPSGLLVTVDMGTVPLVARQMLGKAPPVIDAPAAGTTRWTTVTLASGVDSAATWLDADTAQRNEVTSWERTTLSVLEQSSPGAYEPGQAEAGSVAKGPVPESGPLPQVPSWTTQVGRRAPLTVVPGLTGAERPIDGEEPVVSCWSGPPPTTWK